MTVGKELIRRDVSGPGAFGYNQIFIAGGTNPISDEEWDGYVPDFGYEKNTTRLAFFTGSPVLSSPGYPTDTFVYFTDSNGYTWLWNTQNRMAIYPFDQRDFPGLTIYQAGSSLNPPGTLQVLTNWKNQPEYFAGGDTVYHFIQDEFGNGYILGAYDVSYDTPEKIQAQFDAVVLPAGWTKSLHTLEQSLTIYPVEASTGGNTEYEYNQVRDSNLNNYFQYIFSESGDSVYQQVPGMAIYAGNGDERRNGTSLPDFIHGGDGSDRLYGFDEDDSLYGDDGDDILYGGKGNDYIFGGLGEDVLYGQKGKDSLTGDAGADQYCFTTKKQFGNSRADMIIDFNSGEGDTIGLSSTIFKTGVSKGLSLKSISGGSIAKYMRRREAFVYDQQTGSLYYNQNGRQAGWGDSGGLFVALAGAPSLSQSDLVVM